MIPLNAKIQIFLPPETYHLPSPILLTRIHTLDTLPSTLPESPSLNFISSILLDPPTHSTETSFAISPELYTHLPQNHLYLTNNHHSFLLLQENNLATGPRKFFSVNLCGVERPVRRLGVGMVGSC
jgi:hypothetical protein